MDVRWNEALSGAFGSVSLAAWIVLLVPQLVENYAHGHADGISLAFLLIWFVGDVTNLAGAAWAGLVPTVIALAVYFCLADLLLISQCVYYSARKTRRAASGALDAARAQGTEQTPLLNGHATHRGDGAKSARRLTDVTADNLGLPGSRRASRASVRRPRMHEGADGAGRTVEAARRTSAWVKNTAAFAGVCAVGAAGWAVACATGAWRPTPAGDGGGDGDGETRVGAEVLGYISAVCYLGARIPQIIKNQRERSCDGLSLLFFLLSLLGNVTYGAGILFHSRQRQYIITNLPWLIGSLGTIVEDAVIFIQFHAFGVTAEATAVA